MEHKSVQRLLWSFQVAQRKALLTRLIKKHLYNFLEKEAKNINTQIKNKYNRGDMITGMSPTRLRHWGSASVSFYFYRQDANWMRASKWRWLLLSSITVSLFCLPDFLFISPDRSSSLLCCSRNAFLLSGLADISFFFFFWRLWTRRQHINKALPKSPFVSLRRMSSQTRSRRR